MLKSLGGGALLVAGIAINSQATVLSVGGAAFPGAETLAGLTDLTGTGLVSSYANGGNVGTLTSWVYSGNSLGGLTFVYLVTDTGADPVDTLVLNDYSPLAGPVDVGYVAGAGVIPFSANWSITGTPINFNFTGPDIVPGGHLDLLIVTTSATGYAMNTANVDDGVPALATDYSPVPEPTTVLAGVLLLLPLCVSGYRIVRNRKLAAV